MPFDSRDLLEVIQNDLPLKSSPFLILAQEAGVKEEDILSLIEQGKKKGQIRRYGAALRHIKLGLTFNVMAVFDVSGDEIDTLGAKVSAKGYISHCYERERNKEWPFNLYAMIHARDEEEGLRFIDEIKAITNNCPFKILKSLKEYKKTSLRLL
ncbi:MAG: Lrp/AsnC family transcriptional regulator [Candidatus Omnitrophota bacterium]